MLQSNSPNLFKSNRCSQTQAEMSKCNVLLFYTNHRKNDRLRKPPLSSVDVNGYGNRCRRCSVLVVSTGAVFTHRPFTSLTCKGFEASNEGDGCVVGRDVWSLPFAEYDYKDRSVDWLLVLWAEVDSDRSNERNFHRNRISWRASRVLCGIDLDGDGLRNGIRNSNGLKERI